MELPDGNLFTRKKGKSHQKRLNSCGPFAGFSLLEYSGLNPIPPFPGGRSDAACRVVILPFVAPVDAYVGVHDGRCGIPRNDLLAMPTVGAGSSQREDSPAHLLPAHTIQDLGKNHINDAARVELRRGINNCDATLM